MRIFDVVCLDHNDENDKYFNRLAYDAKIFGRNWLDEDDYNIFVTVLTPGNFISRSCLICFKQALYQIKNGLNQIMENVKPSDTLYSIYQNRIKTICELDELTRRYMLYLNDK